MPETDFRSVQFEEVDWSDTTCLITYGPHPEKLLHAIDAVGLLQWPLLQQREDGLLRIVCGSRRLTVCRKLGIEPVPCQVFSTSVSHLTCLRMAIYDNVAQRVLNPVEKSLVLTKMAEYVDRPQLIEDVMPLLDLEPSVTLLQRYEGLQELDSPIVDAVAGGSLHERIAFALRPLRGKDRLAFLKLFEQLPFSVSVQEELLETIMDISRRDGVAPRDVINDKEIRELRQENKRPLRQRAQDIRICLQARRSPRLTARKQRFLEEIRQVGLPPGLRLEPPPHFEGSRWRLEFTFHQPDELTVRLRQVARLTGQPAFRRLLKSK
ncbi:MAG: ParB/RepB/Spo0J family partition protein [Deltaproteobacteria bacterium]|nr:MAG: ParB/RepB/Spo0J family partition protein [Deltaproteobacteria bacterium]